MEQWRYCLASIRGTSHERGETPCQDYSEVVAIPDVGEPHTLIAVTCDGAGSAENAAEGARLACLSFLEFARLRIADAGEAANLPRGFHQDALAAVRFHLGALAEERGASSSSFACTLVGAIVTQQGALFIQLGDGASAFRSVTDSPWEVAIQPQRGEFANETVFVTRDDAGLYIAERRVRAPIVEFALMTDGVEHLAIRQSNTEAHSPFFEHVIGRLRDAREAGECSAQSGWLAEFLASDGVNQKTDDDKSLILASRMSRAT